jgi:hypothetical protein
MDGFGSNGGEEFLSYLQTGESMLIIPEHFHEPAPAVLDNLKRGL